MRTEEYRRDFIKHLALAAVVTAPVAGVAEMAAAPAPSSAAKPAVFNVADFGAVGDGKTLCTNAIQKAIVACAKSGGGKVMVPPGRYLTSALFLKSDLHLEISAGATLAFTTDFNSVPSISGRWEGLDRTVYASLLNGDGLHNVSITGAGTLDGQGKAWWDAFRVVRELRKKAGMGEEREPENPPGSPLKWGRPRMINLYRSKNILIAGLHIVDSPSWNIHPVLCENVNIDGVTIVAPVDSPNTDGIDPDSCKNVRISNSYISVGDDCIVIKSGYRYREDGVPSENVTVTNCVFGTGHCGVGIGSETSGGVKNVVVSNCVCDGTQRGLRIKTARSRGNVVEDFRASNIIMRNVEEAITVTMFYTGGDRHHAEEVNKFTPTFRNLHFSDISVNGAKQAAIIEGLAEMPIRGLSIRNFEANGAANGVNCINVIGLCLEGVTVNADKGPALNIDSVRDLELCRVTTRAPKSNEPVVRLTQVTDAVIQLCTAREGTGTFLEISGAANHAISLIGNQLSKAAKAVTFSNGAKEEVIAKQL